MRPSQSGDASYQQVVDLSGGGRVDMADFSLFAQLNGAAPAVSGLSCAGDIPCAVELP